jgi:hypothetical protein
MTFVTSNNDVQWRNVHDSRLLGYLWIIMNIENRLQEHVDICKVYEEPGNMNVKLNVKNRKRIQYKM